jgi:hypothetical protein
MYGLKPVPFKLTRYPKLIEIARLQQIQRKPVDRTDSGYARY